MTPFEQAESAVAVMDVMHRIRSSRFTFCGYLIMAFCNAVKADFDALNCGYFADGTHALLKDKESGREYEVTIKLKPERG